MGKPIPKQGSSNLSGILVVHRLQTHILVQLRVDRTVLVTEKVHKFRFSDLGTFYAVFLAKFVKNMSFCS